ncbi:MAG: rod shape-determining protein MreC [Verrucomicrobia bacterium]|nr:MAG: rod shape-determining protein MreC [Verrucomicrobiota bacterium]
MNKVNVILLVLVLVAATALASMQASFVQDAQSRFLSFLSPFLKTGSAIQHAISSDSSFESLTPTQLRHQIAALSTENARLRATIQLMQDLQEDNQKLRKALNYRNRSVFRLLPARIISRNATTWWSTAILNRGFQDGLETDMPVLTETGLVGKITTVAKDISTVLLLTDENCRVASAIEGSREKGITAGPRVSGNVPPLLELNFLSKDAKISSGNRVYTAGVSGGIFPSGILIGTVKDFHPRDLDGQARVEPAVDLSHLEDVFVVVGVK